MILFFMGSAKHRKTLQNIFTEPEKSGIVWDDVISLLRWLGAEIFEGKGSRTRLALNGVRAVFHRPHLQKEIDKGAVKSLRRFLKEAGCHADI